ncbi:MAG: HAD family hydrolase, partial [Gammaproteobacteria bacterium]
AAHVIDRAQVSATTQEATADLSYVYATTARPRGISKPVFTPEAAMRDAALRMLRRHGIPQPDVLITSGGTEIAYAPDLEPDTAWTRHIDHLWKPRDVRAVIEDLPGIKRQPKQEQSRFKLSYYIDPETAPSLDEINSLLRQDELAANTVVAFGQFLDILPVRASKGLALRWYAAHWDVALERILVAGGSGADEDMMRGNTLAAVVANRHGEELSDLMDLERIYFADKAHADGILEAIHHYDFFKSCRVPA